MVNGDQGWSRERAELLMEITACVASTCRNPRTSATSPSAARGSTCGPQLGGGADVARWFHCPPEACSDSAPRPLWQDLLDIHE